MQNNHASGTWKVTQNKLKQLKTQGLVAWKRSGLFSKEKISKEVDEQEKISKEKRK